MSSNNHQKNINNKAFDYINNAYINVKQEKMKIEADIEADNLEIKSKSIKLKESNDIFDINKQMFSASGEKIEKSKQDELVKEIHKTKRKLPQEENRLAEIKSELEIIEYIQKCIIAKSENEEDIEDDEVNQINKKEFGMKLLEAQEQERNRIAMDLHDSTVQNLTTLIHKIELVSKYLGVDNERVRLEINTLNDNIKFIIKDMREIIYDLRPMSLNDLGLNSTINQLIENLRKKNSIQILFKTVNEEPVLDQVLKLTIYRIIQEACVNCIKHANASHLTISISYNKEDIFISVADDGIGIDNSERSGEKNFGLSIMREKVLLLSGKIDIYSKKSGTVIEIVLPYSEREETQ